MAVTALYVHVPFCAQKCRYCDFDSRSFAACDLDAALDSYFEQLYARLDSFGDAGALAQVRTVYTGVQTCALPIYAIAGRGALGGTCPAYLHVVQTR